MRRVFRFLALAAVVASVFVFSAARPAAASCTTLDLTGPQATTITFGAGASYTAYVYLNGVLISSGSGSFPTTVTLPIFVPAGYEYVLVDSTNNCASLPASFVLKTITCTTAVFDSAGGNAVPGAVITAGQTWYVNPTPVKDAKGKLWTETYVSGTPNGFVPTSCVH